MLCTSPYCLFMLLQIFLLSNMTLWCALAPLARPFWIPTARSTSEPSCGFVTSASTGTHSRRSTQPFLSRTSRLSWFQCFQLLSTPFPAHSSYHQVWPMTQYSLYYIFFILRKITPNRIGHYSPSSRSFQCSLNSTDLGSRWHKPFWIWDCQKN